MSEQKIKELKDDALMNVKVNKTYYMMCKASIFVIFQELNDESEKSEKSDEFIKSILSKEYNDMSDKERLFYTLSLLVGEIEKQALENKMFIEKDINSTEIKEEIEKLSKSNED